MGFYTKNHYLQLGSKRMIDDLIERDGPPTSESFTPFNGMNKIVKEQMKGQRYSILGIKEISASIEEISLSKLKATSTDKDSNTDENDTINTNYEYLLEDIDESYIVSIVRSLLIGLKLHKGTARDIINSTMAVQPNMYDKETGEVFNRSDVYVENDEEESSESILQIRSKIPYLLKKLQDGSIFYKVSLLSLFIARDGAIRKVGRKPNEIRPRDLLAYPIYNVSSYGDLLYPLDKETANNTQKFIVPKNIVLGAEPDNPFYRAGIELTSIARRLGYNLYDEDPQDYSPSYVNRLMCTYIVTNQELLMDMSYYDPKILSLLKDGNIFKRPEEIAVTSYRDKVTEVYDMALRKKANAPQLYTRIEELNSNFLKYSADESTIDLFIETYKKTHKTPIIEQDRFADCTIEDYILCNSAGMPLLFKGLKFLPTSFGVTTGFTNCYFILSCTGLAIRVDDISGSYCVSTIPQMIAYYESKRPDLFYREEIVL